MRPVYVAYAAHVFRSAGITGQTVTAKYCQGPPHLLLWSGYWICWVLLPPCCRSRCLRAVQCKALPRDAAKSVWRLIFPGLTLPCCRMGLLTATSAIGTLTFCWCTPARKWAVTNAHRAGAHQSPIYSSVHVLTACHGPLSDLMWLVDFTGSCADGIVIQPACHSTTALLLPHHFLWWCLAIALD